MKKEFFLSILFGKRRGFLATFIRTALSAFTYPYLVILSIRNAFYEHGIIKSCKLPVNVISIGNITMGGTGKTPLVELTAMYLQKKGKKTAILSRGYGSHSHSAAKNDVSGNNSNQKEHDIVNDECVSLSENLKDTPILIGKDRAQNGERAIRDYGVNCLILDDGFQHLRIKRDIDIVVIDSLNPFAGESLIPRGTLREPVKNLCRANLFVLSHCNMIDKNTLNSIYTNLHHINSNTQICESIHKPTYIENIRDNSILEPEWLKGKRIYGICAIGNPDSFEFTLKELGADLVKLQVFRDHHYYTQKELDDIISESQSLGSEAIVVTQKDIVKIRNMNTNNANILSLKIEMQITKGLEFYEKAIARML